MGYPFFSKKSADESAPKKDDTGDYDFYKADPDSEVGREDAKFLKSVGVKGSKKAYTLTNQGYGTNSKCYKCQQPIEDGQLSTWEGGMECHAGGCPAAPQQKISPSERIKNMPQRGNPKTPAQLGLTPKSQSTSLMSSKKKAVGLTNQGQPDAVCPNCNQPIQDGEMVNYPNGREAHAQCPAQQPEVQAPGWQSRLNLPPGHKPKTPQISPGVGRPVASLRSEKKLSGKAVNFSFVVPLSATGLVAFQLAKAGMKDFEVINYEQDEATMFVFRNEPEMHVAEEIIRAEFADQIGRRKGKWSLWAPEQKDPSLLPEMNKNQQHLLSSEKTADEDQLYRELEEEGRQDRELHEEMLGQDTNSYSRGRRFVGPQAVPSKYEIALDRALTALQILAEVGPSQDIKGCAEMSAGDLRQFAEDFKAGKARKFSSGQKFTPEQMENEAEGVQGNHYHASEPGGGAASDFNWHQDDNFPVAKLETQMSDKDWAEWFEDEKQMSDRGGGVDYYTQLEDWWTTNPDEHIIVVEGTDGNYYVWDGHHRTGISKAHRMKTVPAFVGTRKAKLECEIDTVPEGKTSGIDDKKSRPAIPPSMTPEQVKKLEKYRRDKLVFWLGEMGFLDKDGNGELLAEYDAADFWKKDDLYEEALDMIKEDRKFQSRYRRTMRGPRPYNKKEGAARDEEIGELVRKGKTIYYAYVNGYREESEDREAVRKKLDSRHPKQGSFGKQAFDPNLTTLVGSWVSLMLVKWLGNEYSKRWGTLAETATQKAEAALQDRGISDLSTLDKYAQEQGTDRVRAFLSLAGRQLALATVVTTGIAATKLFNGEAKAQAAPPAQAQSAPQKAPEKAAPKHHKRKLVEHVTMDVELPKDEATMEREQAEPATSAAPAQTQSPAPKVKGDVRNVDTKLQSPEDEIGMRDF